MTKESICPVRCGYSRPFHAGLFPERKPDQWDSGRIKSMRSFSKVRLSIRWPVTLGAAMPDCSLAGVVITLASSHIPDRRKDEISLLPPSTSTLSIGAGGSFTSSSWAMKSSRSKSIVRFAVCARSGPGVSALTNSVGAESSNTLLAGDRRRVLSSTILKGDSPG